MYWTVATLVGGILAGYLLARLSPQKKIEAKKAVKGENKNNENNKNETKKGKNNKKPAVSNEEYKMVLVVRNDLGMGKGKIAAQCSHATLGAFQEAQKRDPGGLDKWEEEGAAKVVVRAQDEEEMMQLEKEARKEKIITYVVVDAGRTQIACGTSTVLAVGPGPISKINSVTGKLKLL